MPEEIRVPMGFIKPEDVPNVPMIPIEWLKEALQGLLDDLNKPDSQIMYIGYIGIFIDSEGKPELRSLLANGTNDRGIN